MKLRKLVTILNAIGDAALDDAEVRVYLDGMQPLDIDHLEIMLDENGNASEVWLEVVE